MKLSDTAIFQAQFSIPVRDLSIEWYRNGEPMNDNPNNAEKFFFTNWHYTSQLRVAGCTAEDQAQYSVKVTYERRQNAKPVTAATLAKLVVLSKYS